MRQPHAQTNEHNQAVVREALNTGGRMTFGEIREATGLNSSPVRTALINIGAIHHRNDTYSLGVQSLLANWGRVA